MYAFCRSNSDCSWIGNRPEHYIVIYRCFNICSVTAPCSRYTVHEGKCEGSLIGGYLVNFAVMLNGNFLKYDGSKKYILFMEDHICFTNPAAISKFFSHIEQSGLMNCVTGLIFGNYSEDAQPLLIDILKRLSTKYNIPVVKCDDYGHGMKAGHCAHQ